MGLDAYLLTGETQEEALRLPDEPSSDRIHREWRKNRELDNWMLDRFPTLRFLPSVPLVTADLLALVSWLKRRESMAARRCEYALAHRYTVDRAMVYNALDDVWRGCFAAYLRSA